MNFNAAIPYTVRPNFYEGSKLASQRDSRRTSQTWKQTADMAQFGSDISHQVAKISRQVSKLRRQIRGGGSQPSTTVSGDWNYRGLYDPAVTNVYMTFDVVQFGAGTSAGMYLSTIDNNSNAPDSGIGWTQVSTSAGTWL